MKLQIYNVNLFAISKMFSPPFTKGVKSKYRVISTLCQIQIVKWKGFILPKCSYLCNIATCFPSQPFLKRSKMSGVFLLFFALFIDHLPRPGEGNKSPAQRTLECSKQLPGLRRGRWRGCFYRTTCGHNMTDIMITCFPIILSIIIFLQQSQLTIHY